MATYHTNKKLSRVQLAQILFDAGFRGQSIADMIAIAGRESGYDPGAHRTDAERTSYLGDRGLWQVNYVHDAALRDAGIIDSATDLFDPLVNARAAYQLSNGGANLSPWAATGAGFQAGGDPFYGTDRAAANAAYQRFTSGNFRTQPDYATASTFAPPDPTYFDWQSHPELNDQYNSLSPHLKAFEDWIFKNYGGTSGGDYVERSITGGGPPSSHAFGAAFDWAPTSRDEGLKLVKLVTENPGAFGIQAIHDYEGGRIWHVNREGYPDGWKPYDFPPGDASDTHFHFEVDPQTWDRAGKRNWRMMGKAARGVYTGSANPNTGGGGPPLTPPAAAKA